jgi:amino acid transporter
METRPAAEGAVTSAPGELAHDSIGLGRVIGFTAGFIGPAASIVLGLVVTFSITGFATPFVVLVALIGALLTGASISEFARRTPSAGGLYTYNVRGLGHPGGFITGWLLFFAYMVYVPGGVGASASFFSSFFHDAFSVNVSENVFFFVVLAVVAGLAYRGISASSEVDLTLLAIEVLVILALAITILGNSGHHLTFSSFDPAKSLHGRFSDLTLGMVFTAVIFGGFEAAAVLGEESRDARRIIPRGIFGSLILVGAFYLIVSFAETQGVGFAGMPKFAASTTQLQDLTSRFWSSGVLWIIDLVVALSTLGFTIAVFNSCVRYLFAMGRESMLPPVFARTGRYRTPDVAIGTVTVFTLAVGVPMLLTVGGFNIFAYLGTIAGLCVIIAYMLVNLALIIAFRTKDRAEFKPVRHLLVPLGGMAIFAFPLVGTFYPKPAYPFDILPYIALGWLVLGIGVVAWLARTRPATLANTGKIFIES